MNNRKSRPSHRRGRRSPAKALLARQREDEIVKRRLRGQSFTAIADAMGMSISACHESFWRALAAIPVKSVKQYRVETCRSVDTRVQRTS